MTESTTQDGKRLELIDSGSSNMVISYYVPSNFSLTVEDNCFKGSLTLSDKLDHDKEAILTIVVDDCELKRHLLNQKHWFRFVLFSS